MIENTNTKQLYPGPILNNTLEITDFLFNDAEQIKIKHSKLNEEGILIDIDLNYPTDYEVTKILPSDINAAEAALTASTGQVTLKNVNVLAGEKLTVYRVSQIIQNVDYPRTGTFPAASHEGALDYLTMQNQEQSEEIARSLKVPISTFNFNAAVPIPLPKRILRINDESSGFEFVPYDLDDRLDTFENATEETIVANQAKVEADFNMFKVETNTTLDKFKSEINTSVADIQTEVDSANYKADSAITTAASANNKADTAVNTANTAIDTANSALGIANISNTTANSANSTANDALTIANNASTVANSAKETADEASNKVDEFETNISSVISAAEKINELEGAVEEAKTAADTASVAAENATKAADNAVAALGTKQDVISDLETIRQDASKGATALQSYTADKPNIANINLDNLSATGEARFSGKADISLSNLNATGQAKFDAKQNVTTAVTHTANTAVGNSSIPVYIASNGVATSTGKSIANSRFDGQWVSSPLTIKDNIKTAGSWTLDLSSYLPSDSYAYEVLVYVYMSYSNIGSQLTVGTVAKPYDNNCLKLNIGVTSGVTSIRGSEILPVGVDRKIYIQLTAACNNSFVVAHGYRRIGTNT